MSFGHTDHKRVRLLKDYSVFGNLITKELLKSLGHSDHKRVIMLNSYRVLANLIT